MMRTAFCCAILFAFAMGERQSNDLSLRVGMSCEEKAWSNWDNRVEYSSCGAAQGADECNAAKAIIANEYGNDYWTSCWFDDFICRASCAETHCACTERTPPHAAQTMCPSSEVVGACPEDCSNEIVFHSQESNYNIYAVCQASLNCTIAHADLCFRERPPSASPSATPAASHSPAASMSPDPSSTPHPTPIPCGMYHEQVVEAADISPHYLQASQSVNHNSCKQMCQLFDGCNTFTFDEVSKTCTLYDTPAPPRTVHAHNSTVTLGMCPPPSPSKSSTATASVTAAPSESSTRRPSQTPGPSETKSTSFSSSKSVSPVPYLSSRPSAPKSKSVTAAPSVTRDPSTTPDPSSSRAATTTSSHSSSPAPSESPAPSVSAEPSSSRGASPTSSVSKTPPASKSRSASSTRTQSPTKSASLSSTRSRTTAPSRTRTASVSFTSSATQSKSVTNEPSVSSSVSRSHSISLTNSASNSAAPSVSAQPSVTPTISVSSSRPASRSSSKSPGPTPESVTGCELIQCDGIPLDFYVSGDFMSSKASLDGQLYVGGDATISHATIGNTLPVSLGSRNDLVVNGALNYHSGHVVSGNVYFGAGSSVGSVVVNGLSEGAYASEGTGVFDFASATDCYLEQTEVYCGLNQTGYHETHFRDMLFTAVEMSSDDYAVFHATCEDLADKVSFDFSMKSSHQTAVVNVYGGGESCSFNANVNYHPSKVLFNFCDTPELHVRGSTSGSILAPGADIIGEELSMTGQLIGKSFSGNLNSQSHALFDGCLPLFR